MKTKGVIENESGQDKEVSEVVAARLSASADGPDGAINPLLSQIDTPALAPEFTTSAPLAYNCLLAETQNHCP